MLCKLIAAIINEQLDLELLCEYYLLHITRYQKYANMQTHVMNYY